MDITMQTLMSFAGFIFVASLKGALLVAWVLLLQKTTGRFLSAGTRYLLWVPVIIALLTPIGVELRLPAGWTPANVAPEAAPAILFSDTRLTPRAPAATEPSLRTVPASADTAPAAAIMQTNAAAMYSGEGFAWSRMLAVVWLAGVIAVAGTIAVSCLRFSRSVRRAMRTSTALQNLLNDCMRQTSCGRPVRLMHSTDIQVPMIAGLLRPVLLLPKGIELQLTRAQLCHVFIHELMHLQRGDIIGNWIMTLVQTLHWFNPIVWFAFFRMRLDRELACDAATLKHLAPAERAGYGRTLLQLNDAIAARPVPVAALGMLDAGSDLQTRILMLVRSSQYRNRQTMFAALLFLPLAAAAFSQPVPPAPKAAMTVPVQRSATAESVAIAPAAAAAEPATATANAQQTSAPAPAEAIMVSSEARKPAPAEAGSPEPAAAVAAPAVREPRTPALQQPDGAALFAQAAPSSADPVATAAEAFELAAVSAAPVPATETYGDLPAIQQLAEVIAASEPEAIAFIEEVERATEDCDSRGGGLFSVFTASCTKKRAALRGGQIFRFGYQCFLLQSRQEELEQRHRDAAAAQNGSADAERVLRETAQNLAEFCGKETYAAKYPVFATMFAEAESLKYFKPSARLAPGWPSSITNERWFEHTRDWGDHLTGASLGNINTPENWGTVPATPPAFTGGMTGNAGAPAPAPSAP